MQAPKDLHTLFAALREAKILVGPREVLRIHEILSRAENLDVNGLRSILAAVLVKSREEKQRFDDIFRSFLQVQDDKLGDRPEQPRPPPIDPNPPTPRGPDKPPPEPREQKRFSRRTIGLVASVVVAALGGAYVAAEYLRGEANVVAGLASSSAIVGTAAAPVLPRRDSAVTYDSGPPEHQLDAGLAAPRDNIDQTDASIAIAVTEPPAVPDTRSFSTYVPRIDLEPQSFFTHSSGAIAGLGILTIVLGLVVSRWRMRIKVLPPRAPAPTRTGPRELALSSPAPRDLELLDMQSEDALVWGIGRFVTEEFTTTLDIEGSIAATVAAGGRPELRFERRGRHRQVCLWIDESAKDPAIERLGREISLALSRVGLEVEVARFWAVPDKLVRQDGTSFTVPSVEEELAFSIVAILTDGHALTTRHAGADRRFGISRLMRMFARLPRLAFVDFGEGPSRASRVARAYGITSVRPDEAAAFLALGRKPDIRDVWTNRLTGDATAWAAACALGMRPVDEETAYDVRRALTLSITPWSWSVVRRSGNAVGDWVEWPQTKRAELLDWLRHAEHGAENVRVDPQSILGKTIAYWKQRLDTEARIRKQNDSQKPWTGTPAERTLRIERAFLDVWDEPELAVKILYSFVGTDAEAEVREKLDDYGSLEVEGTPGVIVLPWRFDGLSDPAKAMFERLGFGPDAKGRQDKLGSDLVERRGRLWMGMGLVCGLGLAVFISGIRAWQVAEFRCVIENVEGCAGWCGQLEDWNGYGSRFVAGGLAGFADQKNAGRTELPTLRFELQDVNCEVATEEGWFVQRCGQEVPPEKPERHGGLRRKIFVLQGDPMDERVVGFGRRLLDRRVADVVLVRNEGPPVGALNNWMPLLDLGYDKLVTVRLQDEEVKAIPESEAWKFERYAAQLPKKARTWTLPEKAKRVWWENTGGAALVFDVADRVIVVEKTGTAKQLSLPGFDVSAAILPTYLELLSASGFTWISLSFDRQTRVQQSHERVIQIRRNISKNGLQQVPKGVQVGPVIWNQAGSRFAGIAPNGSIFWWNVTEATPHEFPAEKDFVPNTLAWSLNGTEIFVGTSRGVTMLSEGQDPISFGVTNKPISSIVGPVAGKYLLISGSTGQIFIVRSDQVAQSQPGLRPIRDVRAMTGAISPDGNNIATVHEGGKIRIATIDDDITIDEFACDTTIAPAWSPDGNRLLVACGNSVYDRPVFPPMFGMKNTNAICTSREKLETTFGARTSEAALMYSHCAPSADF